MKARYALPVVLATTLATAGGASAQGTGGFSYQKQWWPQAVITHDGRSLSSGEAYEIAGPSGPDVWNDPRAWWNDYQNPKPYVARPGRNHGRQH